MQTKWFVSEIHFIFIRDEFVRDALQMLHENHSNSNWVFVCEREWAVSMCE